MVWRAVWRIEAEYPRFSERWIEQWEKGVTACRNVHVGRGASRLCQGTLLSRNSASSAGTDVSSMQDPKTGVYRLLTLTVDIPSARSAAQRAVVFWADPADVSQEGLLEGSKTRLSW